MLSLARRWMKRGDGTPNLGLMPLLFALCALLSVSPGRVTLPRAISPAHLAAFALLSAPDEAGTESVIAPSQRAALLMALCRQVAAPTQTQVETSSTIHSQATAHFALATELRLEASPLTPRSIEARVAQFSSHEVARLNGVRTNRVLA